MKGKTPRRDEWHTKVEGGQVKVFDPQWKFRCAFKTQQEADNYIAQHRKPARG